jgi:hypothetical protein
MKQLLTTAVLAVLFVALTPLFAFGWMSRNE